MEPKKDLGLLGNDFWYKTLPVLSLGMVIWAVATLMFSGILGTTILTFSMGIIIILIISYFLLWILTILLAFKKHNILSMLFFICASLNSGILSSSLLIWASTFFILEIVVGLFFIAFFVGLIVTISLCVLGIFLRDKISKNWIYPLILFGIIFITLEIFLIILFGSNPILLITSILVLIWFFGVIIWDGSQLPQTVNEGCWMLAVIDIFLDMINVIIRIFVIIVEMLSKASD
ncbi:MAG: hypothetical protein ACFFAN_01820 [Promethearchaeota archaeon]